MAIERLFSESAVERLPPHNVEAEEAVLGSALLDREVVGRVASVLDPKDFYRERNGLIYQAMLDLYERHEPVDYLTLINELDRTGRLEEAGGVVFLSGLLGVVPTPIHAEHYAKIIADTAFMRRLIQAGGKIAAIGFQNQFDTEVALEKSEQILIDVANKRANQSFQPLSEILREYLDQLALLREGEQIRYGVPSGFVDLDKLTAGGFQRSDLIVLAARPSMGKCLTWDTPILDGQTGEVMSIQEAYRRGQAGQPVHVVSLSSDGQAVVVRPSAFVDDGVKPVFRVRTRAGREIRTTLSHPFLTVAGWRRLESLSAGDKIAAPRELPVFGIEAIAEAKVCLLAYLLGDGGLTGRSPKFTNACDAVLVDVARHAADFGVRAHRAESADRAPTLCLCTDRGRPNPLSEWLRELGLMGKGAAQKFIPGLVYRLPEHQLALFLNRLFATDGAVGLTPGMERVSYSSVSRRLIDGVRHLLLRFGIQAKVRRRLIKYRGGVRPSHELELLSAESIRRFAARIGVFGPRGDAVAELVERRARTLKRWTIDTLPLGIWETVDAERVGLSWADISRRCGRASNHNWHAHRRSPRRETILTIADALESRVLRTSALANTYWDEIVAIEPDGVDQVYDLSIPETHNFAAGDFWVHNTSLALGIAANAALKFRATIAIFSLEMSKGQLAARLLATESGVDTTRLRTARLSDAESRKLGAALGLLAEAPIYIDDTPGISVTNVRAKTKRLQLDVPIDLVIVDHLQLMTSGQGGENRVQEMSEISRQLKVLARELNVPVLALSQLSRAVESRSPKIPILSDLRESGAIEQDADVVVFIYRDDYYNKDSDKQGIAELHIAKHRNGPTGQISLLFNNRTTKFLDLEVYRE
jgi:replicative DNA helicase